METSRVDGVKAPQHPNPGHWTTDFRLRHVLAEAPLDQILDAFHLGPGVGAGLALAGHGDVCCRLWRAGCSCSVLSCRQTLFLPFGALVLFVLRRRLGAGSSVPAEATVTWVAS